MEPQPSSASVPSRHSSVMLGGILLTFVILLLTVFFFARDYIKNYFPNEEVIPDQTQTVPNELTDAKLLSKNGAYVLDGDSFQAVAYTIGVPELFTIQQGSRIAVAKEGSEFVVRENDEERFRSTVPITALSQTPNTKLIAYSTLENTETAANVAIPPQFNVHNVASADIHIYFPSTDTVKQIVSGHAPLFVNDYQFIFLNPSGVYLYTISNGEIKQLIEKDLSIIGNPVLSSDATQFAFYDGREQATVVYELTEEGATLKTTIPELLLSPTLHRGVLYSLRSTQGGTEVLRFNLQNASSSTIRTLPPELSIHRIIF